MRRFQIDINGVAHPIQPKPLLPPRPLGIFAVTLHDFESSEYFRKDWNYSVPRGLFEDGDRLKNDRGWPQMVPLEPRVGVKLTEELQWFWFKQLLLSYYGHTNYEQLTAEEKEFIEKAWGGLTKGHTAFTNGRGTDTCWDFIRNVNRKAELPILWENTCGGSLLELNSDNTYAKGYKVKTLRTSDYEQWKDWTFRDHPQFFTLATNATPFLVGTRDTVTETGPWKVDPMHYLDGKNVPVPLISDAGHVFIEPNRVRILSPKEETPSPYVG